MKLLLRLFIFAGVCLGLFLVAVVVVRVTGMGSKETAKTALVLGCVVGVIASFVAFGLRLRTIFIALVAGFVVPGLFFPALCMIVEPRTKLERKQGELATSTPAPATTVAATIPASPVSPVIRAGQRVTLLRAATVELKYGTVTMPLGTVVTVLTTNGQTAEVRAPDGSHFVVPIDQVR